MFSPKPPASHDSSASPCLESLLVLGGGEDVQGFARKMDARVCQDLPADPISYQVWWQGQPIGYQVQCVAESRGLFERLLANETLPESADVFIVQASGENRQELGSFPASGRSLTWKEMPPSSFPEEEVACFHLIQQGVFDRFLKHPHPMESLAQEGDLDALADLLKGLSWEELDMQAWWRCAKSWVFRVTPISFFDDLSQEVGQWDDHVQQEAVFSLLGKYVPREKIDAKRLASLIKPKVQRVSAHTSGKAFACARLLREVVGDEKSWDLLEIQPNLAGVIPTPLLDWFSGLDEEKKGQVLGQSLASLQAIQKEEGVYFITLSKDLSALFESYPQWEGWDGALSILEVMDPGNESVLGIVDRRRRQEMLEEATSDPSLLGKAGRPRF